MKKRHFLLMGLGTVGALTVGWGVMPARQRLNGVALPITGGQIALNAWLKISADGMVTLAMPKAEMGQGIHTALAMIVAEELDVPLTSVRIEQSPIDRLYGNVAGLAEGIPFRKDNHGLLASGARWTMTKVMRELGIMMTGGSSSVNDLWPVLRDAAAMTRASLVAAVAAHWDTAIGTVLLVDGVFTSNARSRQPETAPRMTLGDAVRTLGAHIKLATEFKPKAIADFKLLGQPTLRTDAASKTDGSAAFGMDAPSLDGKRPDVYAAVVMSPVRGGAVTKVDSPTAIVLKPNLNGHGASGGVLRA